MSEKITEKMLDKIQQEYESGRLISDIAPEYGVTRATIGRRLKLRGVKLFGRAHYMKVQYQKSLGIRNKICTKCRKNQPLDQFSKRKNKENGKLELPISICKSCQKDRRIMKRYGLEPEKLKNLLELQKGKCEICKRDMGETYTVDHNHITGEVRGLLCNRCNFQVGVYETRGIEIAKYLKGYNNEKN
jgi:predicted transcriptional regulator